MNFMCRSFAQLAVYCDKQGALIPVSFVLGFYVSIVVGRWWDQYRTIPWPDAIALFVSASVHGQVNYITFTNIKYTVSAPVEAHTLIEAHTNRSAH